MEHIGGILSALNDNKYALILLILIFAGLFYGVKKHAVTFSGKGLRVGYSEVERKIMREQLEYVHIATDATIRDLPEEMVKNNYYRCKYVISKYRDIFESMITFNHITTDETYVSLKQELAYDTILKITEDPLFHSDKFQEYIYKKTADIISRLVKIRKAYE